MPTRGQTINDAVEVFRAAQYPSGLDSATAWLGIYQALLWYERVEWVGFDALPHIIDADKLRPSSDAKKRAWKEPRPWQKRAQALELYLAEQLACEASELPAKTDLLMKQPSYDGLQRQNTLGIAFAGLIKHVLESFGSNRVSYGVEMEASSVFPGITFPGRSETPRIDLLAMWNGIPRAIISAKWSVRHDRLSDITNECPVYKAAYERIFRQAGRERIPYFVATNEYDPSRLNKMLDDTCVDAVVHVHKAAVVEVCNLDGRLNRLWDLPRLITATTAW